jgi:hypothetical protein
LAANEPWSRVPPELNTYPVNDNDGLCVFCAGGPLLLGHPLCLSCLQSGLTMRDAGFPEVPHAR